MTEAAYTMHFDYTAWAAETDTASRREAEWRRDLAREQIKVAKFSAALAYWRDVERRALARLEQLSTTMAAKTREGVGA